MDVSKIAKRKIPETRTTCKLTRKGEECLDYLMTSFKLTHKKIFAIILSEDNLSEALIDAVKQASDSESECQVKKTLVIVSDDLKRLNELAGQLSISRSILIDCGIRSLAAFMKNYKDQEAEKYKIALETWQRLWGEMEIVEKEMKNLLDDDDPYLKMFSGVIVSQMNLVHELEDELKEIDQKMSGRTR